MIAINHHKLGLSSVPGLNDRTGVEVWDDSPREWEPPHVSLCFDEETKYLDLTPDEARALAHLLITAAGHQDRRAAGKSIPGKQLPADNIDWTERN